MHEGFRHECGIRYLCALRHKKGLTWFRKYISEHSFDEQLLRDFYTAYKAGNKGDWGCLKGILSQQRGLGI